mmetsp:Transcript_32173/g.86168  ORF Transcript_32173/g.86168 Transcript_32173/m.86168 type:complete len:349 (-) Transcript_32173:646-1692(-)
MYSQGGSNFSKYSASSTSFSVNAAQSISQSGTLTPFLAFNLPPRTTFTFIAVSFIFSTTVTFINPSSMRRSTPGLQAFKRAICSSVGFIVIRPGLMWSLSLTHKANSTISPSISGTGPPASSATRNFGPCRSPSTSTFLPSSRANFLIKGYTLSKSPPRRCEQFRRKMSVPAKIIFGIMSELHEEGPKLATTFVFLLLWFVSCLFNAMLQFSIFMGCKGELLMATKGQDCFSFFFTDSASRTADASANTASMGNFPLAASPLNMTASVPSHTAFAKSLTSARVGTGASIILSTICVAVITNRPACLALWISSFCAKGTRFRPNSTPRSPRATISAWDFSMIPSMLMNA